MKYLLLSLLAGSALIACSNQTNAAIPNDNGTEAQSKSEITTPTETRAPILGRGEEARFLKIMQEGMDAQMLLYKRISPAVSDMIKPVTFNNDDKDKLRCAYREMIKHGMGDQVKLSMDANVKLRQAILENPDVSFRNIDKFTDIIELMDAQGDFGSDEDFKKMTAINSDCGVSEMVLQKMKESGAQAAMMSVAMEDQ